MSSNVGLLNRDLIGGTLSIRGREVIDKNLNIYGRDVNVRDVKVRGDLDVAGCISQNNGTYDVIICGVGTAGAVAFRRIADANPNLKILGLVTGGYLNDDPISKYPFSVSDPEFGSLNLLQGLTGTSRHTDSVTNHNWMNYSIHKNTINIFAGRGQGGAGMHNFLLAIRPSPDYHDYASSFAGAYSSAWDSVACVNIYKDMETYVGPVSSNRGTTGPVRVLQNPVPADSTYGDTLGDILNSMKAESLAGEDSTASIVVDFNDNTNLNLWKSNQQFLYIDGGSPSGVSRSSSSEGYLGTDFINEHGFSATGKQHRIMHNAYVKRVLFDEDNNAVGVEVLVNGKCKTFKANSKVILSAGAMRTPGILERSGIGSGTLLSNLNIPQVVENPNVGENFQTHYAPGLYFTVDPDAFTYTAFGAFLKTVATTPYGYERSVQYSFNNPFGQLYLQVANSFGDNFAHQQAIGLPLDGSNVYVCYLSMVQPTSRGSVHLFDTGVDSMPKWIYDPTSVEDKYVLRAAYQHMKRVEADLSSNHPSMNFSIKYPTPIQFAGYPGAPTIAFTASIAGTVMTVTAISSGTIEPTMSVLEGAAFSAVPASAVIQGTQIVGQVYPLLGGEAVGGIGRYTVDRSQTVGSMSMHGDYLDQAAGAINVVQAHPSGTCKMGDRNTQQGVVDGQLHVYGVQKLMVADNSIWPQIPDANTTFTAMLAGYRAADICISTI